MSTEYAKSAYLRSLGKFETMTITRGSPPTLTVTVRGRLLRPKADQVVDTVPQGKPKAIVLKEDLDAASFVPVKTDLLNTAGGKKVAITFVDDVTRRVGGELIAYELHLAG